MTAPNPTPPASVDEAEGRRLLEEAIEKIGRQVATWSRNSGDARINVRLAHVRALLTAAREREGMREALDELKIAAGRALGSHAAPYDCYATGPLTGDSYRDLVECPGCVLDAILNRAALQPSPAKGE